MTPEQQKIQEETLVFLEKFIPAIMTSMRLDPIGMSKQFALCVITLKRIEFKDNVEEIKQAVSETLEALGCK